MNKIPLDKYNENLLPEYPHYHITESGELFTRKHSYNITKFWKKIKGYKTKKGQCYNLSVGDIIENHVYAADLVYRAYVRKLSLDERVTCIDGDFFNLNTNNLIVQTMGEVFHSTELIENIPNYKGYHIMEDGRLFRREGVRWLLKYSANSGSSRNFYKLSTGDGEKIMSDVQIVMLAYNGGFDDEKEILFKDGNDKNINPTNLYQPRDKDLYLIKYPLDSFKENLSDFPGIHITKDGRCFSRKNLGGRKEMENFWREMKPGKSGSGYVRFAVNNSSGSPRGAHQLVALAYLKKESPGLIVCHNDGNKLNNHVSNLRWDTHLSNTLDRERHGTMIYGEESSFAKFSNKQILDIVRRFSESQETLKKFAQKNGISHQGLRHIIMGETRSNTGLPTDLLEKIRWKISHSGKKLTPEIIVNIFQERKIGLTIKQICVKYDVCYMTVFLILKRKIWKKVNVPEELLT